MALFNYVSKKKIGILYEDMAYKISFSNKKQSNSFKYDPVYVFTYLHRVQNFLFSGIS